MKQLKSDKETWLLIKSEVRKAIRNEFKDMHFISKNETVLVPINGVWCSFTVRYQHESIRLYYNLYPLCNSIRNIDYFIPANIGNSISIKELYPDFVYVGDSLYAIDESLDKIIEAILNTLGHHKKILELNSNVDSLFEFIVKNSNKITEFEYIIAYLSCLLNEKEYRYTLHSKIEWYEKNYYHEINSSDLDNKVISMAYNDLIIVRSLLNNRPKLIEQMTTWAGETIARYKLSKHFNQDCFKKYI